MYQEPYTEVSAIVFITEAMEIFNKLKDLSNLESLTSVLKCLSASYFDFEPHREIMCQILMRKNYVQITSTIIENLVKLDYFRDDQTWSATYFAYSVLWNFCDFSHNLATTILTTNLPKIIVDNILCESYRAKITDTKYHQLINASLNIVHNIARYPGNDGIFNRKDLKDTLVTFIKRDNTHKLGLISMLTLGVLVDDTELILLEEGSNVINSLITHIKTAHNSSDKRFDGLSIWELVNGLRCISANDNMKKTILQEGGLQILLEVLQNPTNDKDIEKGLGALWNLCFDNEVTDDLKTVEMIRTTIKPYENYQLPEIKRSYDGIIWRLKKKDQFNSISPSSVTSECGTESRYDIFISYAQADKLMVINIKDELLKSNIRVWIDTDQEEGTSIVSLAHGIEDSNIFLMVASNIYRTSPHCRSEAEYAFSLNKPIIPLTMESNYKPSSWLALIVGLKRFHIFSERRYFYDTVRDLLVTILSILDFDTVTEEIPIVSNIETWSTSDVEKWLQDSGLSHTDFRAVEGWLLKSIVELTLEVPEFVYGILRNDYGMTLLDISKFRLAIKNLSLN